METVFILKPKLLCDGSPTRLEGMETLSFEASTMKSFASPTRLEGMETRCGGGAGGRY